jgi:hypothetical protein
MCWNEHVSLNTFLFSAGMLGLLVYNNARTPYKVPGWNGFYTFFILSFILMQLVEFFLWRNLADPAKNRFWTYAGQLLVAVQPIASLFLLKQEGLRNGMLLAYAAFAAYMASTKNLKRMNTKVLNGHLQWNWVEMSWPELLTWLFFLLFSLVYNKYYTSVAVALALFTLSYYSYAKNRTAGSYWCWTVNLSMLMYAVYLLVVCPYKEHGLLC